MENHLQKILVSACLLGQRVRYDGRRCLGTQDLWQRWEKEGRLVPICPEVAGGLPVPRPPAEIEEGDGVGALAGRRSILTNTGVSVAEPFLYGARKALALATHHQIKMAILKEKSPSCGVLSTYDGSFRGRLTNNMGVTAALLHAYGIKVFSDTELEKAIVFLQGLEDGQHS